MSYSFIHLNRVLVANVHLRFYFLDRQFVPQMKCLFLKRLELSLHTFKIIFEEFGFHGNSPLTF